MWSWRAARCPLTWQKVRVIILGWIKPTQFKEGKKNNLKAFKRYYRKKVASSRPLGSLITQTSEKQSGARQHDSPPVAKSKPENVFVVSQGGHFSDEKSLHDRFHDTFLLVLFFSDRDNVSQPQNKWPSDLFISLGSLFKCAFVFPFPSMFSPLSPPRDSDTVISAIIYLLMQTRPCPRCAARQNIHIVVTGRPIKDEIGGM